MPKFNDIKVLRIITIILAVIVVLFSVILVVNNKKNKTAAAISGNVIESYADVYNELSSVKDDNSKKESEIYSYSQAIDEQNSAFSKEKESYQNKINDLNKKISKKNDNQSNNNTTIYNPTENNSNAPPDSIDGSAKTIYLTFDDGPSPRTPEILRILDEYGVKATFFVKNTKYNYYMNDIVNSGHAIGLHTYSHEYSEIYSSDEAYYNDLQKISDVVYNQTGVYSKIIRFPGGSSNGVSKKYNIGIMTRITKGVTDLGYQYFDWNVSSGDASGNHVPANKLIENCKKIPKSNTVIVLMHDTYVKDTTVEALPQIIEYYKAIGCSFGIIDSSTPVVHQKIIN